MSNTLRHCLHVIEAPGGPEVDSWSVHTRALSGCWPGTPARWRALLGANTPWYRMRGGRGTTAARGARNSSGSKSLVARTNSASCPRETGA